MGDIADFYIDGMIEDEYGDDYFYTLCEEQPILVEIPIPEYDVWEILGD